MAPLALRIKNPAPCPREGFGALGFKVSLGFVLMFPSQAKQTMGISARASREVGMMQFWGICGSVWSSQGSATLGITRVQPSGIFPALPIVRPLVSFPPQDLKKYGATTVVRVCEVTYDKTPLEKDGITVMVSGRWRGTSIRVPHVPRVQKAMRLHGGTRRSSGSPRSRRVAPHSDALYSASLLRVRARRGA